MYLAVQDQQQINQFLWRQGARRKMVGKKAREVVGGFGVHFMDVSLTLFDGDI